jgi:acetyltransferase-like isoleucine patch superfamily enzyme
MIKRVIYYLLQIKAFLVFGRRVYAHGNFKVGNRKNVTIGKNCSINFGVYILGHSRVEIGNGVTLSARSMLIDSGLSISSKQRAHIESFIKIEDEVWIGAGAIILPGVVLGRGCVIGAGSVVTKSVTPNCTFAGNPARLIRVNGEGDSGGV